MNLDAIWNRKFQEMLIYLIITFLILIHQVLPTESLLHFIFSENVLVKAVSKEYVGIWVAGSTVTPIGCVFVGNWRTPQLLFIKLPTFRISMLNCNVLASKFKSWRILVRILNWNPPWYQIITCNTLFQ